MSKSIQNVVNLDMKDVVKVLTHNIKKNLNTKIYGPPGVGKSAAVREAAQEYAKTIGKNYVEQPTLEQMEDENNFWLEVVLGAQIDELDTRGGMYINKREGKPSVATFTTTSMFPSKGHGIIFLDESDNAQQHIQTALQPIIQDRVAGDKKISDDIVFILASNRPDDGAGANGSIAAMKSRAATYDVVPMDVDNWLDKMDAIGIDIDKRINAFLRSYPRWFMTFDSSKPSVYAYGCPRTWHKSSISIEGVDDMKMASLLIGGWCGQGAGDAFHSFLKLSASVDINDLLAHPDKISNHEDDIGKLYSICITLVDKAVKSKETTQKVFNVMKEMSRDEFGLYIFNALMKEMGKNKLLTIVTADKTNSALMARYSKLFN